MARISDVSPPPSPASTPVTVEITDPAQPLSLRLPINAPRLWSPADPHLYEVTVTLESADGTDRVVATTGLRRVETDGDQILLNGERLYVRGVLDQGYWPRTGITAPDDEAFVTDLEAARAAGFNLVRKHLKLEDPRFLHHADRLGMLVWAEPASTGIFTPEAVARFEAQIEPMVRRDGNHPSIVIWGLYNEEWGLDWDVPGDPAKQEATAPRLRPAQGAGPEPPGRRRLRLVAREHGPGRLAHLRRVPGRVGRQGARAARRRRSPVSRSPSDPASWSRRC